MMRWHGFMLAAIVASLGLAVGHGAAWAGDAGEQAAGETPVAAPESESPRGADISAKEAAETQRRERAAARRLAEETRQAEAKLAAMERERSCVIRPAMTDAQIAHCKWAWSVPPP